jgi:hypothetical protein
MKLPTEKERDENAARMAQLLQMALEEVKTPAYRDRMKFEALEKREKFLALMNAGFTESQALYLVSVK